MSFPISAQIISTGGGVMGYTNAAQSKDRIHTAYFRVPTTSLVQFLLEFKIGYIIEA